MKNFLLLLSLIFCISINSFSQIWGWMNPVPTANPLLSINFINPNTGYITGAGGTILKTIDGGNTWQFKEPGVDFDLYSSSFIDENTGYVSGIVDAYTVTCGLLKTTNGGNNWIRMPDNPGAIYVKFLTVNSGYGWRAYKFLKTLNGGVDWTEIPIEFNGSPVQYIHDVDFLDENTGLMTVEPTIGYGMILKTIDGGLTWNIVHSLGNVTPGQITFINSSTGYCTSGDEVLKTTDAGDSWLVTGIIATSGFNLDCISFTDENHGYVAAPSAPKLYKTINGGTTWTKINIPGVTEMSFPLENKGFLLSYSLLGGDTYMTNNGGTTFQSIITGPKNDLRDIAFNTPATGYAVGDDGCIAKTTDEGYTWEKMIQFTGKNFYSIVFPETNIGYIGGESGCIYKTKDGGITWDPLITGISQQINCMFFTDANNGHAAGEDGIILRTTDGGATWTSTWVSTLNGLTGISFCDHDHGIVVGNQGIAYKTSDGGTTWEKITFDHPYFLRTVQYLDINNIYIAETSYYGFIRSTDGGLTWTLGSVGTAVYDLHFINDKTGYFAGFNGAIFYTEDGGDSLIRMTDHCHLDLNAICVTPANKGFVAGNRGTILSSIDFGLGTGTEKPRSELYIFPNPAKDRINISIPGSGKFTAEIIDMNGRLVKDLSFHGRTESVGIAELQPGIYMIRCYSEKSVYTTKFVKE